MIPKHIKMSLLLHKTNLKTKFSIWIVLITSLVITNTTIAKEYIVSSAKALKRVERSLSPGDVVILRNGDWHNQQVKLTANGQAEQPIYLKAETAGQVKLTGNSSLSIKGSSIIVSGLLFADGALNKNKNHVISLEGNHHRLTESAIINYNPQSIDKRYFWVSLTGNNHRVDHNFFSGQNHSGVTNVVWLKGDNPGHHKIDNNYYGQRPKGNGNGFETIRVGTGKYSHINSHVVVEHNVFEESDGEIETISNKSNYNIYRNNTFVNSSGTLTLRQGQYNIVEGNYFLGQHRKGSGGVRIISKNQLVINNHFENLAGRAEGIISITSGNGLLSDDERPLYPQVENAVIAGNVCINTKGPCITLNAGLGKRKRTLLAKNVLIANNTFHRDTSNERFITGKTNDSIIWSGNWSSHANIGYHTDGIVEKKLSLDNDLDGVNKLSPAPEVFTCDDLESLLSNKNWANFIALKQRCLSSNTGSINSVNSDKQTLSTPKFRTDVGPAWLKPKVEKPL